MICLFSLSFSLFLIRSRSLFPRSRQADQHLIKKMKNEPARPMTDENYVSSQIHQKASTLLSDFFFTVRSFGFASFRRKMRTEMEHDGNFVFFFRLPYTCLGVFVRGIVLGRNEWDCVNRNRFDTRKNIHLLKGQSRLHGNCQSFRRKWLNETEIA